MELFHMLLCLSFISFITWFLIYYGIFAALKHLPLTSNIPKSHRYHIAESSVSGLHGIICAYVGVSTAVHCMHDVIGAKYPFCVTYVAIGSAYFLYDILAMYITHITNQSNSGIISYMCTNYLMIAHHLTLVFILGPVLMYQSPMGHFFAGCFYAMEMSTPFLNFRAILSRLGWKSSKLYLINGLVMMFVFTMCRIVVFPVMYMLYLMQQPGDIWHSLMRVPLVCHASCVLVGAPQVYWLRVMIRGAKSMWRKEVEDKRSK